MPLPRSLKRAPGCVPAGTCTSSRPSSVGTLIVPPSASVGKRDRHLAIEVVFLAMEERVLLDVDDDVEIARRAAGGAVLALAVEAQPLAGGDAGGNLDRELALAADAAGAAAGLARLGDRLAGAAAVRARPRDGEEALLVAQLAGAAALRAGLRRACPAAAPEPLQVSQVSSRGIWIDVSVPVADSSNEISRS